MNDIAHKPIAPQWFFAWTKRTLHITPICAWTKRDLIVEVEKFMGEKWRNSYRKGGRCIKCNVIPKVD